MSADDKVGYKHPPKASQFKKGTSGNPKGRPKGSRSILAAFERVIWGSVQVRQGDQRKSVSKIEAMLMALAAKAMQGDHKAIDSMLKLMEKLQLLAPKSPLAPASTVASSSFTWTEEDESMRPFLEGMAGKRVVLVDDRDDARTDGQPNPSGSSPVGDFDQPSAFADKAKG